MKDGYIRIAAVTPDLKVADVTYNISKICENIRTCAAAGAKVIVFPELCMTGYSCGDLFLQELLIERAMSGLSEIAAYTKETDAIVFVGLPVSYKGKLYNTAGLPYAAERFWALSQRRICRTTMNFMNFAILQKEWRHVFPLRLAVNLCRWEGIFYFPVLRCRGL